jgi:hypothetical protein
MLLHYALLYHLDVIAFTLLVAVIAWTAHRRVPEEVAEAPYPRPYLPALAAIVLVGIAATELSGERERRNLVDVLRGLAPTFASELMALGLARMGPETPADDPDYLRMIEAQKRWLSSNKSVKDIYTAVLTRDDRVLLIVDSETDYNRDGDFDDNMEHRVPVGEELDDVFGEFHAAMLGDLTFGENPHQDAWGFWVSAYENPGNNVDGLPIMVGLDYAAMEWLTQIQLQRGLVLVLFGLMAGACVSIARNARLTRFDVIRERRRREQLEIASQTAEAASMAKGAFLASISHEIRTPMNGVLGMLELLGTTPLTDEQSEYIDTAYRSGKALLEILNDVLDYSKVEAGMLHIETIPTNLRNLLQDITSLHTTIARSRGLSTSMHVAPDVPEIVRCDPFRLRQILNNLIGNALKFTSEGGISLMVETSPMEEVGPDVLLRFSVRDSGIGIPREIQDQIFDPFTQADQSTSRRFGGTGLGLAICRRLVTMMGGQIGVESARGIGSIFWFTLPAEAVGQDELRDRVAAETATSGAPAPAPVLEPPVTVSPAAVAVEKPTVGGQGQAPAQPDEEPRPVLADVLVVEDNDVNQLVTGGMLKRLGYSSDMADDGEQALAKLGANRYRVVLMDMRMPGMDGIEATRRWRAREGAGQRTPIIAMTANVLPEDRELCREAGMDDFIGKPVHIDELREKIAHFVAAGDAV